MAKISTGASSANETAETNRTIMQAIITAKIFIIFLVISATPFFRHFRVFFSSFPLCTVIITTNGFMPGYISGNSTTFLEKKFDFYYTCN